MSSFLNEFDFKDIPQNFRYSSAQEGRLLFNINNGFKLKGQSNATPVDKEQAEIILMSKLEEPKNMLNKLTSSRKTEYSYSILPNGVQLHKGEELGMFQMGSTIALLFECPNEYHIVGQPGDKVMMGQELLAARSE